MQLVSKKRRCLAFKTVCHKPTKVLARKAKKGISALTSAERRKNVTSVICTSATSAFISPMLIFPEVRVLPELIDKAPIGIIGRSTKSGWINS